MKPSGPGLLFIGSFNYRFNFIAGNRSVHMLYFFLVRSRELVPKNLFISSRLSLLLEYICLEDSGTSWGEPRCLGLPGGPALSPQPRGQLPRVFCSLLDAAGLAFGLKPDSEHHMGFVLQHISGNHAGDWKLIPRYSRDSLYTRISSPCAQHSRLCYLNTGMGRGLKLCYR